jgi:hypothetical protein
VAGESPTGEGGRFAIVVATDRYDDTALPGLVAPMADADALADALGDAMSECLKSRWCVTSRTTWSWNR